MEQSKTSYTFSITNTIITKEAEEQVDIRYREQDCVEGGKQRTMNIKTFINHGTTSAVLLNFDL